MTTAPASAGAVRGGTFLPAQGEATGSDQGGVSSVWRQIGDAEMDGMAPSAIPLLHQKLWNGGRRRMP